MPRDKIRKLINFRGIITDKTNTNNYDVYLREFYNGSAYELLIKLKDVEYSLMLINDFTFTKNFEKDIMEFLISYIEENI